MTPFDLKADSQAMTSYKLFPHSKFFMPMLSAHIMWVKISCLETRKGVIQLTFSWTTLSSRGQFFSKKSQ